MNELIKGDATARDVELYDPKKGLKTIAVAEASQKVAVSAVRADPDDPLARKRLHDVVKVKLTEQRNYVVWRDKEMKPRQPGSGNKLNRAPAVKLPTFDPGQDVADRWRKALVKNDFDAALKEAQHRSLRVCEQEKTGAIRGTEGTGENEWFTPVEYIERARRVLAAFDLDPASHSLAQGRVRAGEYFTLADDGLSREWRGRVWLNPPYAQPAIEQFVDKLIAELDAGRTTAAIMLTHNYTDTAWFHKAQAKAPLICFTRGRIAFESPDGERAAPTQGQAFFYYGDDLDRFRVEFADVGFIR